MVAALLLRVSDRLMRWNIFKVQIDGLLPVGVLLLLFCFVFLYGGSIFVCLIRGLEEGVGLLQSEVDSLLSAKVVWLLVCCTVG